MRKLFAFCLAVSFMTVVGYAANTGIRQGVSDYDDDLERSYPASATDRRGGSLDAVDLDNLQVVFIRSGSVVVQDDYETSEDRGGALSSLTKAANDYGYYIDVNSSIGSRLYVPSDYVSDGFYVDGSGFLHGLRNSTFTCFIGEYQVRFPVYGVPQYRHQSGQQYIWSDLNIEYIDSPNVSVLGARFNFWDDRIRTLILFAGLGVVVLCLRSMKR